jgi:hypothetical protein
VLLAAAPSSLLLGVTTYLTTDLAPVPWLWVVPLMLYLLSFRFVKNSVNMTTWWALGTRANNEVISSDSY